MAFAPSTKRSPEAAKSRPPDRNRARLTRPPSTSRRSTFAEVQISTWGWLRTESKEFSAVNFASTGQRLQFAVAQHAPRPLTGILNRAFGTTKCLSGMAAFKSRSAEVMLCGGSGYGGVPGQTEFR